MKPCASKNRFSGHRLIKTHNISSKARFTRQNSFRKHTVSLWSILALFSDDSLALLLQDSEKRKARRPSIQIATRFERKSTPCFIGRRQRPTAHAPEVLPSAIVPRSYLSSGTAIKSCGKVRDACYRHINWLILLTIVTLDYFRFQITKIDEKEEEENWTQTIFSKDLHRVSSIFLNSVAVALKSLLEKNRFVLFKNIFEVHHCIK